MSTSATELPEADAEVAAAVAMALGTEDAEMAVQNRGAQKRRPDEDAATGAGDQSENKQNGQTQSPKRPKLQLPESEAAPRRPPTDRDFLDLARPADGDPAALADLKADLVAYSSDAVRVIAKPSNFIKLLCNSSDRIDSCLASLLTSACDESSAASGTAAAVDLLSACFSRLVRLQVRHLPLQQQGAGGVGNPSGVGYPGPRLPSLRPVRTAMNEVRRLASEFGFGLSQSATDLANNAGDLAERLPPPQLGRSNVCRTGDWTLDIVLADDLLHKLMRLADGRLTLPTLPVVQLPSAIVSASRAAVSTCFLTGLDGLGSEDGVTWSLSESIDRIRKAFEIGARAKRVEEPKVGGKTAGPTESAAAATKDAKGELANEDGSSAAKDAPPPEDSAAAGDSAADSQAAPPAADIPATDDEKPAAAADGTAEPPVVDEAEAARARAAADAIFVRWAFTSSLVECLAVLALTPPTKRRLPPPVAGSDAASGIRQRIEEMRSLTETFGAEEVTRPMLDAITECLLCGTPDIDTLGQSLADDPDDALSVGKDAAAVASSAADQQLLKFHGQPLSAWLRHHRAAAFRLVRELASSPASATAQEELRRLIDATLTRSRGTVEWSESLSCLNSAVELGVIGSGACLTKDFRQRLLAAFPPGIADEANLRRVCCGPQLLRPPAYTVHLDAESGTDADVTEDCQLDSRLGRPARYTLYEFSVRRPARPFFELADTAAASGDFASDVEDTDVGGLSAKALALFAARFAFNGWGAYSVQAMLDAVEAFLADATAGAADAEAATVAAREALSSALGEFWSGVLDRVVADRRTKLSVPYVRAVLVAFAELRSLHGVSLQPQQLSLEAALKNVALAASWTDSSADRGSRRVAVFKDFRRECLSGLGRCHKEPMSLRPTQVVTVVDKHMVAYMVLRKLFDLLFNSRDWFTFAGQAQVAEHRDSNVPKDPLTGQMYVTALMEALFWYRMRLGRVRTTKLALRHSRCAARLRAKTARDMARNYHCGQVYNADWFEPAVIELLVAADVRDE